MTLSELKDLLKNTSILDVYNREGNLCDSFPPDRILALIELVEGAEGVLLEIQLPPYSDSDLSSLLKTLKVRASCVLERLRKWEDGK